jgi:acylphosphatase
MRSVHVVLRGRVQGVGFRAFVQRRAREHGVRGEVRNTPDGAVELTAEGDDARLETFLGEVREGPLHARVEHVDVRELAGAGRFHGFSISG